MSSTVLSPSQSACSKMLIKREARVMLDTREEEEEEEGNGLIITAIKPFGVYDQLIR